MAESEGIHSVETAYSIVNAVAHHPSPMTMTAIAAKCGMSRSQLFRYLVTLQKTGFLQKDLAGRWSLGSELIHLGLEASARLSVQTIVQEHLVALRGATGETVAVAIWGIHGPFFVQWLEGNNVVNVGVRAGTVLPLLKSATGEIFTAFTDWALLCSVNAHTDQFDLTELETVRDRVRQIGYSCTEGGYLPGLSAVSAPVLNSNGTLVAALTVVGFQGSLETHPDSSVVRTLLNTCATMSRLLAYRK
ncbi:MAG: IclR family transcriptional regulator [Firmicutes bacterium]|jgi:DNA-binding IclR family transcriptional regulator|nr:IclR family transcriptional regulator [Bacillota bacterium]MCL5971822.1 IclR family transcriptional regulator [Bacillota bacterium]